MNLNIANESSLKQPYHRTDGKNMGILIVISLIIITCTLVNYKRGVQPRVMLILSLVFLATLLVGLLDPIMRSHPFASVMISLGISYGLYYYFKFREKRSQRI
jgi:UDP-N-acetylmuramyl pentapeptide phosphotransferase/UDP-N-acetylglucosamine-1-phosphate transferase